MTREQHVKLIEEKMKKMLSTMQAKNSDYCGEGESADPFHNFKLTTTVTSGRVSTEDGILTRMTDKISRIGSLLGGNDAQVKDESLQDAILDLSAYCLILSNYLDSKQTIPMTEKTSELKASKLSIDELKVGDKVKVIAFQSPGAEWERAYGLEIGDVGIVESIDDEYSIGVTTKTNRVIFTFLSCLEKV